MKKSHLFVGILLLIWLLGVGIFIGIVRSIRAPEITISGVADRAIYPYGTVLRPQVRVKSFWGFSPQYEVFLNGVPYQGNAITRPDLYTLKVVARDFWGHRAMKIVSFVIDTNPAEKLFDFVPISVEFSRTPAGNTKVRFFLYVKKVSPRFRDNLCGSSATLYYKEQGWDLIPVRLWRVLPRKGDSSSGWLLEYAEIFASDSAELLRQAILKDRQQVQFDLVVSYTAGDCADEQSKFSDYWLDKTPLSIDFSFVKSFRRENRFVLMRGHPNRDGIADEPHPAMNFKLPSGR